MNSNDVWTIMNSRYSLLKMALHEIFVKDGSDEERLLVQRQGEQVGDVQAAAVTADDEARQPLEGYPRRKRRLVLRARVPVAGKLQFGHVAVMMFFTSTLMWTRHINSPSKLVFFMFFMFVFVFVFGGFWIIIFLQRLERSTEQAVQGNSLSQKVSPNWIK